MENNKKLLGLIWTLFFLLNNLDGITSSTLKNPNLCGYPACEHSRKFNYLLDTNYVYKYSVDVATLFRGTSENRSTLYVEALVNLRFIAPCQGVLQLSQISLTEEKPGYNREEDEDIESPQLPKADSFAEALTQNSLRFSFNDGAIDELCPPAEEPVWVLNFKRGVLSAFHNTMKRFDVDHDAVETDVNGNCETLYHLKEARGTSLVIDKSKKFSTCTNRYKYHTIIQANQYNFGSDFKTVPLVKSRHQCEFTIDHKIYTHIECEEIHTFQPFSRVENGSQTITRQRLHLLSENSINSTSPEIIEKRTDLLFDHNATPKPLSGELKASRDLVKSLCKLDVDDVQVTYPNAFTKFIQVARHLSYTALIQIYNRAGSICSSGKKHVMDAFSYLGSNAAVMVMKDAILKDGIPEEVIHEWLFSISLIPRPDEETLASALPLIYHPKAKTDAQFLLSVSALAHSYCRHHSNCHKSKQIQELLNYLEEEVGNGCSQGSQGREADERVLIALKSLGNIGLTTDTLEGMIMNCIENEKLVMDVRVAAIQSYRRLPCSIERDYFLKVFRNTTYDTELRIAAYLEVMRCPNYFVVSTIKMALEEEEVNQVGSFVWSHLTNLLKSSMPSKVEIQSLLTDKHLNEKFDIDRRKFSRNYEQSMFFDEYNVGGNIESNIIFSPKSYIPRSGMVNLTVDLFGESINVFELETRFEGFEHLLELAFGPRAPFSASVVNKEIDKYMRVIRSAQEEQEPVVGHVNEIPNVIDNNFKLPKLSMGMKMFGNEYSYKSLVGHLELLQLVDKFNPERRIKQLLSGKELNFDKASMFLDADYIVPTGVGFPVTLTAVGTAAVHLSMAGNVKSFQVLDLDIEGKLRPSVAVDITGQMGVDAYYASTGIKLKTSLYSSTAVEGHIKINGTKFARVSFNLPKEKAEIITAQSELIVMKGDKEEIQSGITENRVSGNICSWPSLDHTLGLKMCVDFAFPNATEYLNDTLVPHTILSKRILNYTASPNFILSGPGKLALALYKADPTAKKYVLEYNWLTDENTTEISFVFDTPGSEQHRELSAKLLLDRNSKNLTLLLQGVDNKFEAHGKYKYTPQEKYLDFSLDVNGKKHFVAQIGVRTKEVKYGHIYQPKLYLAINEEKIAELSGTIKVIEKNEIRQWDVNLEFKTKKLTTKLFGYISRGVASFSSDLKLDYHFKGGTEEYLKVKLKAVNKSSKSLTQFNGEFALDTSAYKHYNFEAFLKYQRAQGHAECKIEINTQPHLKNNDHIFTIKFVFSLSQNYERSKLHTYVEVTKPISHIDIKLELKVDINQHGHDQKTTTILILRYATGKEIITTLDLAIPRSELLKLDAKLNVTLPSFIPMIFTIKIDEKKPREYDIEATGVWFSGHNFTAKGIYIDKSEGVVTSHSLKLFLTSKSFKDIAVNGKFLMDDTQFKLDLQKHEGKILQIPNHILFVSNSKARKAIQIEGSKYGFENTCTFETLVQLLAAAYFDNQSHWESTQEKCEEILIFALAKQVAEDSAEHNNEKYALAFKHAVHSPSELELYAEVRYKNSIYSLTTIVNLMKYRQVLIELHLDQHRDIHIALSGINIPTHKQAGIEVKWDANRDPSQRFEAVVKFLHPRAFNYSADLSVSYPGRLVKGALLFAVLGTNFESSARLEWSPADIVDMKLGAVYQSSNSTSLRVRSQLLTPFPGWKRTSLSGGILRENNLLRVNGSVWWQDDQTVSLDVYGDYEFINSGRSSSEEIEDEDYDSDYDLFLHPNIPDLWVKFNASLMSTVPEVKPMSAAFYHKQNNNKFDTIVHFKGKTNELISINSSWELNQNPNSTNVTGTMTLISPYQGYQRGKLVGRLHYSKDFDINGVAELDLDRKKYSATIDGHVKSIRDTMLIIDVDTPIQAYSKISGRIGYSELNRHLTCLWQSPTSSVGFEILFAFDDTSDFDLMFLLATPLEFFSKLLLRGKLKPQMADFRIGLNDLLLGVEGTWRYESIVNLDYRYTLYTPLEGFKENGVVAKIIYDKDIDLELGVKVAEVKIGVLLKCGHKPKTLTDLNGEGEDEDEEDLLRWGGHIAVDTYFYRTIIGNIDIDEIEDSYIIEGNLVLPNGTIKLYDVLLFEDLFTIRNDLAINTSYTACQELKSAFNWSILFGEEHVVTLDLQVLTFSDVKKGSLLLNYTVETREVFSEDEEINESNLVIHKAHVRLNTPWEEFSLLDTKGLLEMEDNFYRTNLTLFTSESRFTVSANIEAYVGFIDASVGMGMSSPTYNIPEFKLSAKRDFTDVEKTVVLTLIFIPSGINDYHIEGTWHYEPSTFVKLRGKLETPIERLKNIEVSVDLSQNLEENRLSIDARFLYHPNIDIKFTGARHDKSITFDAETPIENFKKLHFVGTLNRNANKINLVNGILTTEKVSYNVRGTHEASETVPVSVTISLLPQSEGTRSVAIEMTVKKDGNAHEVLGKIQHGHDKFDGKCEFDMKNGEWYKLTVTIDSTHPMLKHLNLNAEASRKENGMVEVTLNGVTPWKGLETVEAFASYLKLERTGRIRSNAVTPDTKVNIECDYAWSFMEQMEIHLNGKYSKGEIEKYMNAEAFYRNSGRSFKYLSVGVDADLNNAWVFGTNATLSLPALEDIGFGVNLKLPEPQADVHSVIGKLRYTKGFTYGAHTLKYTSQVGGANYGTSGEMNNNQSEVLGNVKLEWGYQPNTKAITNVILMKRTNELMDLQYNLYTPYHKQDTVYTKIVSKKMSDHFDIKAHLYSPRSNLLSSADVKYTSVYNMKGFVNTTTPFQQLPYAGANFEIVTQQASKFRRYFEVMWPNKTAILDSNYTDIYREETRGFTRKVDGKLLVEIPLATRHIGDVTYGYEESPLQAIGHCLVDYNKNRLLDGKYKCDSESRAGFDKDVIDISLENTYFPLGVHYVHEFEYSGGNDGTNYPTVDKKTGDIFKLNNRSSFSLSGLLQVKTTHNGKDIKVKAFHGNRTVQLDTDYYFLDHEFKHSSWISLDPAIWSSYDLHIINKTTVDQDEEHARLNLSYPKRNFTITGFFKSNKKRYESEVKLDWDRPNSPKTVGTALEWYRVSKKPDQQVATISFKHPSFVKDVTFNGTYIRHGTKSLLTRLDVEYSDQPHRKLIVENRIQDLSNSSTTKYRMDVLAQHPATKLDLLAFGEIFGGNGIYQLSADAKYKRSFLNLQHGELLAMLNSNQKAIDFQKRLQRDESYIKARIYTDNACCTRMNGTMAKTESFNYTGDFFVDIDEKILDFNVNMTPDASESFHTLGRIPDARNAKLNVWRDYEDASISDISYYLRLNHSRLVTSRLKWRPTLQREVVSGIEYIYAGVLKHIDDTVDYWKTYTRSETKEAIQDIWFNAKPDIQEFLDNIDDLKSLETDFEEFKTFLNDSYNNNDFYIKDITGAIIVLVDELAIKGHIQSLPNILNEIWQIMGESGEAIRKSLLWIIETIKTSYRKAVDFLRGLLKGDSAEQITALLQGLVDKYDKLVKDLQVTVIRHLEQLWHNFMQSLSDYWEYVLRSIEPTFIKIVHYVESLVWQASNEIMDFLYERKMELTGSPYFSKLANFTQDIDRFYKDITKNDTITNIKKYSKKIYEFLKEKYFTIVPFGKEIQEIIDEIINEFKELQKLPSINYLVTKTNEIYEKAVWMYESLDLGTKAQTLITLIHSKLTDVKQTALQADSRYREAKTKFIFDTDEGLVLLEQKLPMSWHAFNETPKFEEIPEYRVVAELQNHLTFSNKTFWALYYEYKPYTEIQNWLPPFKGQAIIAGTQFFMTFDKTAFEFRGPCEYLLARDFVNGNFSLVMEKDPLSKSDRYIITLISNNVPISIDMFSDTIRLPKGMPNQLPVEVGHLFVYRENAVVTIEENDGFALQCNMLFKVCTLHLSGWYYGKTAGLLGTMDHEYTTDLLMSNGRVTSNLEEFAHSWALNPQSCGYVENNAHIVSIPNEEVFEACVSLFKSKNSQFSTCFNRINPTPFMTMCLNARKSREKEDVCTAAVAYTQACAAEYTPLPIPDTCIQCTALNGEIIPEGENIRIMEEEMQKSSDVVFIIEAKECNNDLFTRRNMDLLLSILSKELIDAKITDNRFAIVLFGGDGIYNKPRALMMNQNIFTTPQLLMRYFRRLPIGNGNEDIFEAIAFASHLEFRPGVSKTFIVLPCSNCDPSNVTIEYTDLREVLIDGNIKLHILMNNEFSFEKQRVAKIFYGLDGKKAFTKKDFKVLLGDSDLRRQATLPKTIMGYCAPLALETNGTIFTAKKLETDKKNAVKKFASVFGKRVALHAHPSECQNCECSRYDSGAGNMICHPCVFPSPADIDLCLNDYGCDFHENNSDYDDDIYTQPDEHGNNKDDDEEQS